MPAGVDEGIVKGLYRFNTAESAGLAVAGQRPAHPAAGLRHGDPLGAGGAEAARRGVGRGRRRVVRDVLDRAAPRRAGGRRGPAARRGADAVRDAGAGRRAEGPVLAVSDWMRQVPDQIAQWVEQDWSSLGADGFGLSDTREAARRHFGVDAAVDRRRGAGPARPARRGQGDGGEGSRASATACRRPADDGMTVEGGAAWSRTPPPPSQTPPERRPPAPPRHVPRSHGPHGPSTRFTSPAAAAGRRRRRPRKPPSRKGLAQFVSCHVAVTADGGGTGSRGCPRTGRSARAARCRWGPASWAHACCPPDQDGAAPAVPARHDRR